MIFPRIPILGPVDASKLVNDSIRDELELKQRYMQRAEQARSMGNLRLASLFASMAGLSVGRAADLYGAVEWL